ncbi:nucleoside deaminase [Microlunatus parietis]|uniref:Guanine deaminase n=1 Tax=Microlunatus parietis TaxID=682979 RepID=A0A7Y9I233_9ACTN|nr:nucleoside deaminase [Microlunatus parietis]NYE68799.1 guanine deaminase [Microlunatus parietis]
MSTEVTYLGRAIELAVASVADGGGPFGAVIVRAGEVIATGQNRVTRDHDPSAHAEVVAIRTACRVLGTHSLEGCVLYASCEPCPMCLTTSLWARLDEIVYAADRYAAARSGFDDQAFYELLGRDRRTWPTLIRQHDVPAAEQPFATWNELDDKIGY